MTRTMLSLLVCGWTAVALGGSAAADAALLEEACGECHTASTNGLSRIEGQRKTPEGWLMTIVRMRIAHGMEIAPADQARLVAYLSDTQGLAPSETEGWRYALERDPSAIEAIDEPLGSMCARCHTGARVALQRRTAEEWRLHMHFHVGQFPTIEYQAGGRDREWFKIAVEEVAPLLAEQFPIETPEWAAWQAADKAPPEGEWLMTGNLAMGGEFSALLTVSEDAPDLPYRLSGTAWNGVGSPMPLSGQMTLYTGYEWRASVTIGNDTYRQIFALSEDGQRLEGRQFLKGDDSLGGRVTGMRTDGPPGILGVVPSAVPAGQETAIRVVGVGLDGLDFGRLEIDRVRECETGLCAYLTPTGNSHVELSVGGSDAAISTYESADRIAVEPDFTIARVGGGSDVGPSRVPALFRAFAFWNGPDGEPATDDDIRIGEVPATWSVANNGEAAEAMNDVAYAGEIDATTGLFTPAVAGPNPARQFSTNNAGDLMVRAEALGLTGEARLIVTVQRFIDPPIR